VFVRAQALPGGRCCSGERTAAAGHCRLGRHPALRRSNPAVRQGVSRQCASAATAAPTMLPPRGSCERAQTPAWRQVLPWREVPRRRLTADGTSSSRSGALKSCRAAGAACATTAAPATLPLRCSRGRAHISAWRQAVPSGGVPCSASRHCPASDPSAAAQRKANCGSTVCPAQPAPAGAALAFDSAQESCLCKILRCRAAAMAAPYWRNQQLPPTLRSKSCLWLVPVRHNKFCMSRILDTVGIPRRRHPAPWLFNHYG
jgi:hypothetical protein